MMVYARPYYIFEREGRQVVTYGTIINACYNDAPFFLDGAL